MNDKEQVVRGFIRCKRDGCAGNVNESGHGEDAHDVSDDDREEADVADENIANDEILDRNDVIASVTPAREVVFNVKGREGNAEVVFGVTGIC